MTTRTLFATRFYQGELDDAGLLAELEEAALSLAREDRAGRAWSRQQGYPGYTSYASLNDLPVRNPVFDDLRRALDKHVRRFVDEAYLDLGGRRPKLDSLWVNVLKDRVVIPAISIRTASYRAPSMSACRRGRRG